MLPQDIYDEINERLDLSGVPDDTRDKILLQVGENVVAKLTIALFDALPKEKVAPAKALADSGKTEVLFEFFRNNIRDIDALMEKEANAVIDEVAASVQ